MMQGYILLWENYTTAGAYNVVELFNRNEANHLYKNKTCTLSPGMFWFRWLLR